MGIVSCRERSRKRRIGTGGELGSAVEMLANERQIRSAGLGLPGHQATFGFGPA